MDAFSVKVDTNIKEADAFNVKVDTNVKKADVFSVKADVKEILRYILLFWCILTKKQLYYCE